MDNLIQARQAVTHQCSGEHALSCAGGAQDLFACVNSAFHGGELDDACAALERVKCAEYRIEAFRVVRRLLENQQSFGRLLDEFA